MYVVKATGDPVCDPISVTEMKLHLKVDTDSTDDTLIAQIIAAAVDYAEMYQAVALVARPYTRWLDDFPTAGVIQLPFGPVMAVSSITYVDVNGATQTLATSVYGLTSSQMCDVVYLKYDQSWPSSRGGVNDVAINYVSGSCAAFTANASTDVITVSDFTPVNGLSFKLSNTGGALPAGLSTGTTYYMVNASGQTCKLSTSLGGTAVDITGAGTGTHFLGAFPAEVIAAIKLIAAHLYDHRSENSELTLKEVPFAARALLDMHCGTNY